MSLTPSAIRLVMVQADGLNVSVRRVVENQILKTLTAPGDICGVFALKKILTILCCFQRSLRGLLPRPHSHRGLPASLNIKHASNIDMFIHDSHLRQGASF